MTRTAVLLVGASLCCAEGFEVASVKPNLLNDRIVAVQVSPDGRFMARGYTLALLIQRAFAVRYGYVSGGPGWVYEDRFDIAAKASVSRRFTEAQLRPMLAKLLAERFRLIVHTGTKEVPGYGLEIGRSGVRLARSAEIEEHPDTARMTNEEFTAHSIGTTEFARILGNKLGVVVADETGLDGTYDIHVRWNVQLGQVVNARPSDEDAEEQRAQAFRAVEQQLGLKLKAKKVAVPTVVIEHAEKPSPADN